MLVDRFHLLMNLGEATKRIFQSKGKELREVFTLYNASSSKVSKLEEIEHPAEIRPATVDPHWIFRTMLTPPQSASA